MSAPKYNKEAIAKLKAEKKAQKEKLLDAKALRRKLDKDLDLFESKLEDLKVLYEQYFIDVVMVPPDKPHAELKRSLRALLKAPFRNSSARFRLRMLVHRYQAYRTYWERVMREREEGRYARDVFKADLREKLLKEAEFEATKAGAAERGMRQLYKSYEQALKKSGSSTDQLNFDAFKKSLLKRAKQLKQESGFKKVSYKVVVKSGKVIIKASVKE